MHPIMARYVSNTNKGDDPRGWGRWKGVQVIGRKKKTLIIGTYAPSHNTKKTALESMWQIMVKYMATMRSDEKEKDPMAQYIVDLTKLVRQRQREGFRVIVIGDLNLNIRKDKKTVNTWKERMQGLGMTNMQQAWWPKLQAKCYTWQNGNNKAWIDHVYVDSNTAKDGTVRGVGIDTSRWTHGSDHCMIGMRVNFTTMVGRVRGMPVLYQPPKRTVMAGQAKNKKQYREIAERREREQKKKGKGIIIWTQQLREANKNARNKTTKQRKTLQVTNDRIMRKIVKELKAIEQEQADQLNKFGGTRTRHNWSDVFSRRNGIYALLLEIIQRTRKKRLRPQIYSIVKKIIKRSQIIGMELGGTLSDIPQVDANEREWKKYDAEVRRHLTDQQRSMHMRQKVRWRMNMKKFKKHRDEQRKNNTKSDYTTTTTRSDGRHKRQNQQHYMW